MRNVALRLATVLAISLCALPALAGDDVCKDRWVKVESMSGCPARDTCWLIVDPEATRLSRKPGAALYSPPREIKLSSKCDYRNVHFKIARSNTTFDCGGATLNGPIGKVESDGSFGITVEAFQSSNLRFPTTRCSAGTPADFCPDFVPLENVTVRNCKLVGFDRAVRVAPSAGAGSAIKNIYVKWFDHLNERKCQIDRIEDCLRVAGPLNVRIENVHARRAQVGIHLEGLVTGATIVNSSSVDSGSVGIYLSPGSRENTIERTVITGNYREGIALDASADNVIRQNYIRGNGVECADDTWFDQAKKDRCRSGITLFKNFWEAVPASSKPRNQHASGNLIEQNEIVDHLTGVFIGFRQEVAQDLSLPDLDPVYLELGSVEAKTYSRYMRERAENNSIIGNTFTNNKRGVVAYDDGAIIKDNVFSLGAGGAGVAAIHLGSEKRMLAGEPVQGAVVTGNTFANGLQRSVYSAHCTVGNTITGNFDGPAPTSAGCDLTRAAISGSYVLADGSFAAQSAYREAAVFEPGQTWLDGSFDEINGDDLVNVFITDDGRVRMWLHGARYIRATRTRTFDYQTGFQTWKLADDIARDGTWVAGNFNGEGGDDLVYLFAKDGGTCLLSWFASGNGFMFHGERADPRLPIEADHCFPVSDVPFSESSIWLAARRNTDARTDLVQVYRDAEGYAAAQSYLSLDGWLFPGFHAAQRMGLFEPGTQWLSGDFNGDGWSDLVSVFANAQAQATAWVRLGHTDGFAALSWLQTFSSGGDAAGFSSSQRWLAANFNGDAYDDLVLVYGRQGEARARRNASTGAHFDFAGLQTLGAFAEDQRWLAGRFNDDEKADLVSVSGKPWE